MVSHKEVQGRQEICLEIGREKEQTLGLAVNDRLEVTEVKVNSLMDGVVWLKDVIKMVNEKPVENKQQLAEQLQKGNPVLQLKMIRGPFDLEKLIQ